MPAKSLLPRRVPVRDRDRRPLQPAERQVVQKVDVLEAAEHVRTNLEQEPLERQKIALPV